MTGPRRKPARRHVAAIVAVASVFSVVTAAAQTEGDPPEAVATEALQMTGHRPEPISIETPALEMTGYRSEPVAVETDGFAMTGYRPDPATVDTPALRMTGYRIGPVTVDTEALRMTGYRTGPVNLETDGLRMTGYRTGPVAVDTGALQMTGYGGDDEPPEREPPVSVVVDTDALKTTGYHRGPLVTDTGTLRMSGYRRGPASVDTDALRMTGYRTGPATVDTAVFRMTGYAPRLGEALPPAVADLEIVKFGPVSCEAGAMCPFRFLIRNVGKAPFEGVLSVYEEPTGAIAGIGAVGPAGIGWACLPAADDGDPMQCLAPTTVLAPGAAVEASLEARLPSALPNGARFENCVRLAPPQPGANATRFAQFMLSVLGIDPGPIDGQSGPKTRAAVAAFQAPRGLAATGEVDRPTLGALAGLFPADGNAGNDRACVSIGVTKTIACGVGERVAGDTCVPICTGQGAHWNGAQCVVCASGTVWSADGRRCVEVGPACNPGTTVRRGQECVCAYAGMQRVSATDCGCPAGTNFVAGQGCVAARPQCPFGKVYNPNTNACDFICIPPGVSTARGCACPNGAPYRIGGCPPAQPPQRVAPSAPQRAKPPPPQRANPPPLLRRLFQQ